MSKKMTAAEKKRLLERPYYAVLYAINKIGGRLPEEVEAVLAEDPYACMTYAKRVVKGRLPDHLHNAMLLGVWEGEDKKILAEYLQSFPEVSDA
jgi:hypothetical protein